MQRKYFKIIILIGILGIASGLLFAFPSEERRSEVNVKIPDKTTITAEKSVGIPDNTVSITLIAGEKKLILESKAGATLYDTLIDAKNKKLITFAGKNYSGLGFFVTDIEDLRSSGNDNLMYYVNGEEASVGVSSYKLVDGDIISWELK